MTIISIFTIGFSIIIAMVLLVTYLFFIKHTNKTWITIISCTSLLASLSLAQYYHYMFYVSDAVPLSTVGYRLLILFMPPTFYFFSRAILFPEHKVRFLHLLHFSPVALAFIAPREVTVPIAFLVGTGYSLWLTNIVFKLRTVRKRFGLVFFFFAFFSVVAVIILIIAFTAANFDSAIFIIFIDTTCYESDL